MPEIVPELACNRLPSTVCTSTMSTMFAHLYLLFVLHNLACACTSGGVSYMHASTCYEGLPQ